METKAHLLDRGYSAINQNRRRLLFEAYEAYPELVYCDPEQYNWQHPNGRTNIFDLYYLQDSGFIDLTRSYAEGHRRPDFFMLTPLGADLIEKPGLLDGKFPLDDAASNT